MLPEIAKVQDLNAYMQDQAIKMQDIKYVEPMSVIVMIKDVSYGVIYISLISRAYIKEHLNIKDLIRVQFPNFCFLNMIITL